MVRDEDDAASIAALRGRRAAFNELGSYSGRVALELLVGEHAEGGRFFREVLQTGAHELSAEAVAGGDADLAVIDCHTFALMVEHRPAPAGRSRAIDRGPRAPAPPFVAGPAATDEACAALHEALDDVGEAPEHAEVRRALLLDGVVQVPVDDYLRAAPFRDDEHARAYRVTNDPMVGWVEAA